MRLAIKNDSHQATKMIHECRTQWHNIWQPQLDGISQIWQHSYQIGDTRTWQIYDFVCKSWH